MQVDRFGLARPCWPLALTTARGVAPPQTQAGSFHFCRDPAPTTSRSSRPNTGLERFADGSNLHRIRRVVPSCRLNGSRSPRRHVANRFETDLNDGDRSFRGGTVPGRGRSSAVHRIVIFQTGWNSFQLLFTSRT